MSNLKYHLVVVMIYAKWKDAIRAVGSINYTLGASVENIIRLTLPNFLFFRFLIASN